MSQTLDRSLTDGRADMRSPLSFGLIWMVLTAIGFAVGLLAGLAFMWNVGEGLQAAWGPVMAAAVIGVGGGLIMGTGVGLQALALRGRTSQLARWVIASALGGAVGLGVLLPLMAGQEPSDGLGVLLAAGAFLGLVIGGGQWLAVRHQAKGFGWWIAVSTVAVGLALVVAFGLGEEGRELVSAGAGGLVAGAVEGAGMAWLGRRL